MPHQCVHCGKVYPDAAPELLMGCSGCKSHFFYFIKKEYYDKLNKKVEDEVVNEIQEKINEIDKLDKEKIEQDVRDIIGITEKEDIPVILDLESIRILGPGKFEIDVVNLFNKKRPLIYKLEEGKYIIDLASTLKLNSREIDEKSKIHELKTKKR
jgi:predicted  nucleic acid-binding Zn-ribbon protein